MYILLASRVQSTSQGHRDTDHPPSVLGPRTLKGTTSLELTQSNLPSTPLMNNTDFLHQRHLQSSTVGHSGPGNEKWACLSCVCHSLGGLATRFPFSGSRSYSCNHSVSFSSLVDCSCWSVDCRKQVGVLFNGSLCEWRST